MYTIPIDVGLPCKLKCGIAAGAIIGGSVAALGSLTGAAISSDLQTSSAERNVDKQIAAQKEENQLNRDYNTAEAEKARQFSHSEAELAAQRQESLMQAGFANAVEMQKRQIQSQSPVYQRQQLQSAGINPQVYFGSNASFTGGSAPSSTVPSAPQAQGAPAASFAGGLSPVSYQPSQINIGDIISRAGSIYKDIADAKKSGVETERLEKMMGFEMLNAQLQAEGQTLLNALNRVDLSYRDKKLVAEITALTEQSVLMAKEGKKFDSEVELNKKLETLNENLATKYGFEGKYAKLRCDTFFKSLNAELDNLRSQVNKNDAEAENQRSQASFTSYQESMQRALEANNLDRALSEAESAFNQSLITRNQVDATKYAAEQSRVAAEHAEATFWKDFALDVFSGGMDAFLGYRNSKSWSKMSDASQKRVAGKIEEMKFKYGDKATDTYTDSRGHKISVEYHTNAGKYHRK